MLCSLRFIALKLKIHYYMLKQDGGLSAAQSLVSSLPPMVRSQMAMKLGEKKVLCDSGMNLNSSAVALQGQRFLKD